jgi:tetraacyldisaccharide 4'-kinase
VTRARTSRSILRPLAPIYRFGLALRELQLRSGLKRLRRLRWPVVSVGNLSTGGSGKTPLTIALAKALAARGMHVDVLSRGYGRRCALPLLVDSSGTVEQFGDEPLVIAREARVPVYVAAERYEAGLMAERDAAEQIGMHLLDDGFQHRQLARDVDVLLLSRNDLNDRLLPAGSLRETLRAAARADVIAIPEDEPELEAEIRARDWKAQIWHLRRQMDVPCVEGAAAFCGIARPEQFFDGIERAGVRLVSRFVFRDHHRYTQSDFNRIVSEAQTAGATALLTTEKDYVRLDALATSLPASLPLKAVPFRVEIGDEAGAVDWLRGRLGA